MPNVPLPSNRHSAATFPTGSRVYDQVTRQMGTVGATTFRNTLTATTPAKAGGALPSLFNVPDSRVDQVVSVALDDGSTVVRMATQLHDVGGAADAGTVDLNRVKKS